MFFFLIYVLFFHLDTWWKPIPTGWATGTKPSGQGHWNAIGDGSDWGSPPARVPRGSQVQGCRGDGCSPQCSPSAESKHPDQSACCVITDRRHYLTFEDKRFSLQLRVVFPEVIRHMTVLPLFFFLWLDLGESFPYWILGVILCCLVSCR